MWFATTLLQDELIQERIINMYVNEKLSTHEISKRLKPEKFKTSQSNINRFLISVGVTRNFKEAAKLKRVVGKIQACEHCSVKFLSRYFKQCYCEICCPNICKKTYQLAFRRLRIYGLSQPEFEVMWEKQKGLCFLCDKALFGNGIEKINVDHDHQSGYVRGLLCTMCNIDVGFIEKFVLKNRLNQLLSYINAKSNG